MSDVQWGPSSERVPESRKLCRALTGDERGMRKEGDRFGALYTLDSKAWHIYSCDATGQVALKD